MPDAFAVVHTWPELRNAEYEVLQRLLGAAKNTGHAVVVIDNNGKILWSTPGTTSKVGADIRPDDVEFLISLHFESPRMVDIYSYYALWQPIDYYYDFGYQKSIDKFSSHNDLLSCDSDLADAHAINIATGLGRTPELPLPKLFHMVPEPYLTPNITAESKLFYIGINWERLGRNKGRFHDTLTMLDSRGLTSIYGPEKLHGVAPWEGFNTYEGELPFDGQSVLRAINRAGVCLALSSASHKRTGIMSNRLFEGLAGGAAVIATPNPLIDKHFRDVVYLVDDSRGEAVLGQMILEAMREIRSDTLEATRRVIEGQRILREHCSLEDSIRTLFREHGRRSAHFDSLFLEHAEITIFLVDDHGMSDLLLLRIRELFAQKLCVIDLHVICDYSLVAAVEAQVLIGAVRSITVHGVDFLAQPDSFDGVQRPPDRSGPAVARAIKSLATPFFAFLSTHEVLFRDHFASLAKSLTSHIGSQVACSGALRQGREIGGNRARSLVEMRWTNDDAILLVTGPNQRGRFLFRSDLASAEIGPLLSLLDGQEPCYFQLAGFLAGPLAQSNYASYLIDESLERISRTGAEQADHQQQFIRDFFTCDPRWISRISRGTGLPELVYASAPGTPIKRSEFKDPRAPYRKLEVGRLLAVNDDGPGLPYIGHGFSWPEHDFTWICRDRGIIQFRLPDSTLKNTGDFELVLIVLGRNSDVTGRAQHCLILFNGMSCAYLAIPQERTELRIQIPRDFLAINGDCIVELIPDHLEPVSSPDKITVDNKSSLQPVKRALGEGEKAPEGKKVAQTTEFGKDERLLSMAVYAFGILPISVKHPHVLKANESFRCGIGGIGAAALARGFYPSEADLTWIAGLTAELRFKTLSYVYRPILTLRVWGRRSRNGDPQYLSLTVNGHSLGSFELDGELQVLELPLQPMQPEEMSYRISLRLSHAEGVIDDLGRIVDGRLLGLAIAEIGIFEQAQIEVVSNEAKE